MFDIFYVDILGRASEECHLGTTGTWSRSLTEDGVVLSSAREAGWE